MRTQRRACRRADRSVIVRIGVEQLPLPPEPCAFILPRFAQGSSFPSCVFQIQLLSYPVLFYIPFLSLSRKKGAGEKAITLSAGTRHPYEREYTGSGGLAVYGHRRKVWKGRGRLCCRLLLFLPFQFLDKLFQLFAAHVALAHKRVHHVEVRAGKEVLHHLAQLAMSVILAAHHG